MLELARRHDREGIVESLSLLILSLFYIDLLILEERFKISLLIECSNDHQFVHENNKSLFVRVTSLIDFLGKNYLFSIRFIDVVFDIGILSYIRQTLYLKFYDLIKQFRDINGLFPTKVVLEGRTRSCNKIVVINCFYAITHSFMSTKIIFVCNDDWLKK